MSNTSEIVKDKTIIITGGAQGFGAGIARELFGQGASIVLADIKEEEGKALAAGLNERKSCNRVLFAACDVSDYDSVAAMAATVAGEFGWIDTLISNAGILYAGSLDEMDTETFELVTKVNYTGYFNCVRAVSPYMKKQHAEVPQRFMDIIQINSKSGLKGSFRNFAYAGSKFGGIGLTQSFALELIPYNIKVNAICPGNYFEGPLWADPETGLFRQYLDAGKVPGAKTIDDVKRHYEKQVPARRGCRVSDVVKAINYIIAQEYETGQAIPVTGGQLMLK
ncbi:MAG TPA: SDR family NAD(P)-dependent oxidoreductase [Bacteroidetes bacterium]|nr:SDR family NAD(P)-dependent oxidoreductase [Bacteroidota bacterium]